MHLWSTSKLADQLVTGKVPAGDKVNYFLLSAGLSVVLMYAIYWRPGARSWFRVFEALVMVVVAVGGAKRIVLIYRRPVDGRFFEMVSLISVPIFLKAVVIFCLLTFSPYLLVPWVVPWLSLNSTDSAQAVAYWYGQWQQIFPFLVATLIAFAFWSRLAYHVAYVVNKRGA
jgi:hypothetical protein